MSKKHLIRKKYDETATIYDRRYNDIQQRKYKEVLMEIDLSHNNLIVDVGGGTGIFSSYLKNGNQIINCDISINMLIQAKKKNNLFLVCCDAEKLPFKKHSVDIVTSFSVIQNLPNPLQMLKESSLILLNEGLIVITGLKKATKESIIDKWLKSSSFSEIKKFDLSIEDIAVIAKKKEIILKDIRLYRL